MAGNGTDPELLSLRRLPSTKAAMAMGEQHSRTLGHPPTAKPRKPVPTPRNTLRKPLKPARRQSDQDSQGQTSVDSTSPDESSAGGSKACSISGKKGQGRPADGEDILAALEKIPGVGSLRSSSVGSSLPSLNMDGGSGGQQRMRREEESSHSLGVQSSSSPTRTAAVNGKFSELRDAMMMMKRGDNYVKPAAAAGTAAPLASPALVVASSRKPSGGAASAASSSSSPTPRSPSSKKPSPGRTKVIKFSEDEISVATDDREEDARLSSTPKSKRESMLARPLPELPLAADCRKPDTGRTSSPAEEDLEEGVYSTLLSPDHYSELKDATSALKQPGDATSLLMHATSSSSGGGGGGGGRRGNGSNNYLTMTGTMRKKRREVSVYDVQMSLTPEGLAKIERKARDKYHDRCFCGLRRGLHVFVLSLLAVPFAWVYATLSAFYTGTLTWYNVFTHYNEERGCCHKLLSPLVLLAYPFWIVPVTLALGVYGACAQVSWYYDSWSMSLAAPDGGFFYWACDAVGLGECAPYQVILISSQHDFDSSSRPPTGATEL